MKTFLVYVVLAIVGLLSLLVLVSVEALLGIELDTRFIKGVNAVITISILVKLKRTLTRKIENKQLNKLLIDGINKYGKEEFVKLYNIATENEEVAIKWLSENKSEKDALNKKIMYYELTASEKDTMQEKYDRLSELSDIVFNIRYYRREGYDVQTSLDKIINETV